MNKEARSCWCCSSLHWLNPVKVSWGSVSLWSHESVWRERWFFTQSWGLPLRPQRHDPVAGVKQTHWRDSVPVFLPFPHERMKPLCELKRAIPCSLTWYEGEKKGEGACSWKRLHESAHLCFIITTLQYSKLSASKTANSDTHYKWQSRKEQNKSVNKIRCSPKWKAYEYTV